MTQNLSSLIRLFAVMALGVVGQSPPFSRAYATPPVATGQRPKSSEPIPWSEIGPKAGAQYQGDGLSIVASERGAVLRCVFQKLEAQATAEGLWLTSTAADPVND